MDVFPHLTKENLPQMKQKLLEYIERQKTILAEYKTILAEYKAMIQMTQSKINTAINDLKIIEENFEGKL